MMNREYCLMANYNELLKSGTVINMCLTGKPEGPVLNDYQKSKGYIWVPRHKVSNASLQNYRYWNERP